MRQNKFILTKDHFIAVFASNETGDELWAGYIEYRDNDEYSTRTSNSIGFVTRGSVNSFYNTSNTGESWNHYITASSPLMLVRKNFTNLGLVSTSNNTVFGSIHRKENIFSGQHKVVIKQNFNPTEISSLESDETVDVKRKCKVYQKRDVNTFDTVSQEDLNIHTIPDSEIELDGV